MMGHLSGPVLLILEKSGRGLAIVDGVSLRVTWTGNVVTRYIGAEGRRISLELTATDVLDEEQQRQKIERLEEQLAGEREKLDGMRAIFNDEAYAARLDE